MLQQQCIQCGTSFTITPFDRDFLDQVAPVFGVKKEVLPLPDCCPPCREQQRMAFRNEWHFYRRTCDASGSKILSIYAPDTPYTVYEQSVWWSDQFDPLAYGRPFDFTRPFFEQWHALSLAVPRASIHNANSENSEYTNYSGENRNCYLVVGTLGCEDTYYSYRAARCKNICDCYDSAECELCYEVNFSRNLYNCRNCISCHQASGLAFCAFCNGCQDCFGCVNLRNKHHHIFNKPYELAEYEEKIQELYADLPQAIAQYEAYNKKAQPHRAVDTTNCEDCSGDHLTDCKDCHNAYCVKDSESSRNLAFCEANRLCMDVNFSNKGELQYHSTNLVKNYHVLFCNFAWYNTNTLYATSCFNSNNIFGCVGMKKHAHCILNKQYTKEEYDTLVPRIIDHMRQTGEWGTYFPPRYSPFAFNETAAHVEHPLDRESVIKRGWRWRDDPSQEHTTAAIYCPTPSIEDVPDDIVYRVLRCEMSGKLFKITPQELALYRQMGIAIPRRCPDQRQRDRVATRNPHMLWRRPCMKCGQEMETTYSSDRPDKVACECCYLAAVY